MDSCIIARTNNTKTTLVFCVLLQVVFIHQLSDTKINSLNYCFAIKYQHLFKTSLSIVIYNILLVLTNYFSSLLSIFNNTNMGLYFSLGRKKGSCKRKVVRKSLRSKPLAKALQLFPALCTGDCCSFNRQTLLATHYPSSQQRL